MCMDGNLTGLCCENNTFDTNDITNVHLFEIFVGILTNIVSCNVALDIAF